MVALFWAMMVFGGDKERYYEGTNPFATAAQPPIPNSFAVFQNGQGQGTKSARGGARTFVLVSGKDTTGGVFEGGFGVVCKGFDNRAGWL